MRDEPRSADVWVHPSLEVRPSAIGGHGLFAIAAIDTGVVVIRLGGRLVSTAELHRMFDEATDDHDVDTVAVDVDVHLVLPAGTVAHYANHDCEPTMWPLDSYELATRVPVAVDDELTLDDGLISADPTFRMGCTCGAVTCRSVVTGEDWRRPELVQRYGGHWPTGLQRRIDALAGHAPKRRQLDR